MKHEHKRISPERDLSETEKQLWDKIIENLAEYFNTTEGDDFYERFATLMTRIKEQSIARSLSETESRALVFICKESARGRAPSVRMVAKALGYKSSRSGHRIICKLKGLGLI